MAQTVQKCNDNVIIKTEWGDQVPLSTIGLTRIILKDGTGKKKCTIIEIKEFWLVYKKDNVLHDMMIDKIKRIELENEDRAIYFDSKNRPTIKFIRD